VRRGERNVYAESIGRSHLKPTSRCLTRHGLKRARPRRIPHPSPSHNRKHTRTGQALRRQIVQRRRGGRRPVRRAPDAAPAQRQRRRQRRRQRHRRDGSDGRGRSSLGSRGRQLAARGAPRRTPGAARVDGRCQQQQQQQ
jgi:hypothetical protein